MVYICFSWRCTSIIICDLIFDLSFLEEVEFPEICFLFPHVMKINAGIILIAKENILQRLFERHSMTNLKREKKTYYAASTSILTCLDLRLLILASLLKNCFAFAVCGVVSAIGDKTESFSIVQNTRSVELAVFTLHILTQSR